MDKVSVIIPAYNSSEYLIAAIESVLCQSYKNIEIIVVDDGSTDNTKNVLASYIEKGLLSYNYQENQGPGSARNRGIRKAKGEYIAFLDSDDILLPDSVEKRIAFFERQPDVAMIFTDLYRIKKKGGYAEVHLKENSFLTLFTKAIIYRDPPRYVFDKTFRDMAFVHHPFIKTPTVMVRKSIFEKVGYFNTQLRAAEDIDLWLRISQYGLIGYIDKPLSRWNNYRSILTSNYRSFFEDSINYYKTLLSEANISPKNRKAIRKRIAKLLFNLGYNHCDKGNIRLSRKCFWESLRYYPTDRSCVKFIFLTCLPESAYYFLKRLRQSGDTNGK